MIPRNSNQQVIRNDVNLALDCSTPLLHNKKGFHLQNNSESIEEHNHQYLMRCDFKQRIDSMFDETKSAILEISNTEKRRFVRTAQSECGPTTMFEHCKNAIHNTPQYNDEKSVKNMVQARIEKMFADISSSEIKDECCTPNAQQFQVDYIGSLPLSNKVTSLQGLQEPLKNLYFNYRKNKYPSSKLQALLEISSDGLKVQNCQENQQIFKEQLNPFPSIAVWAALKFVYRLQESTNGNNLEYAFLPLVLDQINSQKSSLFRSLDETDISYAIEKTYDDHSPLFVVIMRQSGTCSNRLQCHGFACSSSEDAIVLAANLYKALVTTMNNGHINNGSLKKRKKIKCRNGLGTVSSVAGSSVCGEQDYLYSEGKGTKLPPPRPPKKLKVPNENEIIELCNKRPTDTKIEQDEIIIVEDVNLENQVNVINNSKKQKNKENEKINKDKSINKITSWQSESGDILTKVVMPRRGSFLNASNGPVGYRYNRCVSNCPEGIHSSNRKTNIHSPLGFIELFNELRVHEGLNNIDEILNTIIDVDGMSFNSLKPIYKEFIFKLAVTLTKDELFQRSKSIMQKQKRKRRRQMMYNRRRAFVSGYRIKRMFHASIANVKPLKYKMGFPLKSHLFPALKKLQKSKPKTNVKRENGTLTSNESFLLGFNRHRKNSIKYHSSDIYKDKSFYLTRGEISLHRKKFLSGALMQSMRSNSLDSTKRFLNQDVSFLLKNNQMKNDNHCRHETVSGYVTCSECSYNSESCKYMATKKCYCSLKKHQTKPTKNQNTTHLSSVSSCSCDTDSCFESEKCYCIPNKKPSIFEQLKQQGFAASESSLSRPSSPNTAWQTNESLNTNENKGKTCLQASKSLEFFHVHKSVAKLQSNHEQNYISSDNNKFESRFECFVDQEKSSQTEQYPVKPFPATNVTNDCSNKLKMNSNNSYLNDSENSDNSDYTFNNYCNNQFNNYSQNCTENEANKHNEMFHDSECFHSDNKYTDREHNRILVVSTRDQKGQVKNSVTPLYNQSEFPSNSCLKFLTNDNVHEDDAISIKKTAEIAALFSDLKVEKKNHINLKSNKDLIYNSLNHPSGVLWDRMRMGSMCIKNINLENSLGYFP